MLIRHALKYSATHVPGTSLVDVSPEMGAAPVLRYNPAFSPKNASGGRLVDITSIGSIAAVAAAGAVGNWHGPYDHTDLLGRPCMRGEGNEFLTVSTDYVFAANQRKNLAIIIVCRVHRPNNTATFFSFGSEANGNPKSATSIFCTQSTTNQGGFLQGCGNDGRADTVPFKRMQPGTEVQVVAMCSRVAGAGKGLSTFINGTMATDTANTNGTPTDFTGVLTGAEIFRVGSGTANTATPQEMGPGLPADIYDFMVFHGDFTNLQVQNAIAKLQTEWGIQEKTNAAFFDGASAIYGSTIPAKLDVSTSGTNLAMQATEPGSPHALGPTWHAFNAALAGNTTAALSTRKNAARSWVNFLMSGHNVYTGHHGINDYNNGAGLSAADTYTAQKALYYNTTPGNLGYLQLGIKIFRAANLAVSNAGTMSAFLDPLNDYYILNYATFLTDLDAGVGQTYDGQVKVLDGRLIQVGARLPFRGSADSNLQEYQDGTHFTVTGFEEQMSGADTPQYGWARALMAAFP